MNGWMHAAVLVLVLATAACRPREGEDMGFLEDLARSGGEVPQYRGRPVSRDTVEAVRKVLELYRKDVAEEVGASEQLASLYKSLAQKYLEIGLLRERIADELARRNELAARPKPGDQGAYRAALASRYMDAGVYAEAYKNFREALAITPDSDVLQLNAAVAAARLGKAAIGDEASRASWYALAEQHYRRAIEIAPGYVDALYGLAVLLFYELDRPVEAEPLLRRALEKETRNTEVMFLLAAVVYRLGRAEEALSLYRTIESTSRSETVKAAARANRQRLEEELRGR